MGWIDRVRMALITALAGRDTVVINAVPLNGELEIGFPADARSYFFKLAPGTRAKPAALSPETDR